MKMFVCIIVLLSTAPLPNKARQGAIPLPSMPPRLPAVVQACVSCHGVNGEGKPDAGFPRISGQSAYYLAKQLDDYASGRRDHATMSPIARGLSADLRSLVADYYARVAAGPAMRASAFTAAWVERGRSVASIGDPERGVQACINCHGPGGVGQPPSIPYLAGLDDSYLRSTLDAWRQGSRRNDQGRQMEVVAKTLASDDVAAVARYFAGLAPPSPLSSTVMQAGRPQLIPAAMTASVTVGTFANDHPGTEGRATGAGGTQGLSQSGRVSGSREETAARSPNEPAASTARAPAGGGANGDITRGRALVASGVYGCTACHDVPGIRMPRGIVGPRLGGLAQRPFIAGQLPNTLDVLTRFLRDPPSLVPATGMPNVGLSDADARHVAAYLYTLPIDNR